MTDQWKKREDALEAEYFDRKEKEALKRIAQKKAEGAERLSPITGKPMIQKSIFGVVVDKCTESGGIWLDAGELEQIIDMSRQNQPGMLDKFFSALLMK